MWIERKMVALNLLHKQKWVESKSFILQIRGAIEFAKNSVASIKKCIINYYE